MAETNAAAAQVSNPDPIRATFLNGENVNGQDVFASVEVGRETREVAITISTRAGSYNLLLTGEGAIDLALRIIGAVGRLRKLDRPTD